MPEASDGRTKKKVLQTVGEWWRQFKYDLTRKWTLAVDKDSVDGTVSKKYDISKEKWVQFCQTRRDPSWKDVRKKAQAIQKQNTAPHVLSRGGYEYLEQKLMVEKTKKKLEEAAQSGSTEGIIDPPFPIRRQVKWKMTRTKKTGQMTSEATKEIAEKIIQSQGLALPPEPVVGPSAACVSTKESYVDPSGNDPETVKVGIEEVNDAEAPIPVPTNEPLHVMWDATVFVVFNERFPLYIKHLDLSKIAHDGQCFSISVIQLWILALKGLDDTPQPKSKAATARWIVVKYFNDVRPLEAERLKALCIQWAQYYLKVKNQT
ncbi:hypothetical protein GmHk_03G007402 [Glycine max]|nr:hypothetical protein GmHk_03G007402 [Glycine max]